MGKKLWIAAGCGLLLGGLGVLAAILIPANTGDLCFYIGIALALVGVAAMLKGAPASGIGSFTGGPDTGFRLEQTAESTLREHKPEKHRSNHVFSPNPLGLCLAVGGAVDLAASWILAVI